MKGIIGQILEFERQRGIARMLIVQELNKKKKSKKAEVLKIPKLKNIK